VARCHRDFAAQRGVNEAHIRSDLQRVNNEAGRQKNKAGCYLYLLAPPNLRQGQGSSRIFRIIVFLFISRNKIAREPATIPPQIGHCACARLLPESTHAGPRFVRGLKLRFFMWKRIDGLTPG
jgi:hypothetical protein